MRRWQAIPMAAIVALTVGAAMFGSVGITHVAASPQAGNTGFELALDCGSGLGVPCTLASGTSTANVNVVLVNNSGVAATVGSFNFNVVTDAQNVFNPSAGSGNAFDSNPDFNQAGVTGTGWACSPPAPAPDTNPSASIGDSLLVCFDGAADGPSVPNGGSLTL